MDFITNYAPSIRSVQNTLQMQPVLFVGSGLVRRYANGPSWRELLAEICGRIGLEPGFDYLNGLHNGDLKQVASALVVPAFDWAWGKGKNSFDKALFTDDLSKDVFLKSIACAVVNERIKKRKPLSDALQKEVQLLKFIRPQAVITTNYDEFVDEVFEGYHSIVGGDVYKYRSNSMGEIYKVHGSVEDPASIVLTSDDYRDYEENRTYVAAKMLTMFGENPIFIVGYSLNDPNVTKLVCDIGRIISDRDGLVGNIFFVEYKATLGDQIYPDTTAIVHGDRSFSIRRIVVDNFQQLFQILGESAAITNVQPNVLRSFISRFNEVARVDIPRRKLEVSYDDIERLASSDSEIPRLLGFAAADTTNTAYPYTMGQLGQMFGYKDHNGILKFVIKPLKDAGWDVRDSDNKYHLRVKTGTAKSSYVRKFSKSFYEIAESVIAGKPFGINKDAELITIGK